MFLYLVYSKPVAFLTVFKAAAAAKKSSSPNIELGLVMLITANVMHGNFVTYVETAL